MLTELENKLTSPVREIKGWVELFNGGSTPAETWGYNTNLMSIDVTRAAPKNKFFGFGVTHSCKIEIIDRTRSSIAKANDTMKIKMSSNINSVYPYPELKIETVERNEKTNQLTIKGSDILSLSNLQFKDLELNVPYTLNDVATAAASKLGLPLRLIDIDAAALALTYNDGANFESTDAIREVLDDIAEATTSIYYCSAAGELVFKRLSLGEGTPVTRAIYKELSAAERYTIDKITSTNDLVDSVTSTGSGVGQVVRNNAFWSLREDIDTILEAAATNIRGRAMQNYNLSWRGNYLFEPGDIMQLELKDGSFINVYSLETSLTYNGGLAETTSCEFAPDADEVQKNPTNLGDALNETFARVDKVNKEVAIVAGQAADNEAAVSELQLNTEGIKLSVLELTQNTNSNFDNVQQELETISQKVEASVTAEELKIEIEKSLENGVDNVTTSTGFTFNEEGLTISKTGKAIETKITEDGMTVFKDSQEMLKANNEGVKATNLHAVTYLIIGNNSRLEDYGSTETGCFWIGD